MKTILRHLLGMVAVLAVLAGIAVQAIPRTASAERAAATTLNDEIRRMDTAADRSEQPSRDDVGSDTADEELSGIEMPNLPSIPALEIPLTYVAVIYWHFQSLGAGLWHKPALFPPIGS